MLPFAQNIQNQSTHTPPRASAPHLHHQVSASMFPNMGYVNPQLSNPCNNNNNSMNMNMNLGNNNRPPGFMNMPNFNPLQQNTQLGNPLLGSFPVVPQLFPQNFGQNSGFSGFPSNGQMGQNMNMGQVFGQPFGGWQNQVQGQNVNQLGSVMLNPAHVAALSQLIGCANQGMVPQNAAFIGNPQLGLVQANSVAQQGNFGPQLPMVSQQLQNVSAVPSNPALVQPQLNQSGNFQGNLGNRQAIDASSSGHHQNKNFAKNTGKTNWRSQKSCGNQMHKAKGKHKPSKIKGGKAIGSAGPDNALKQSEGENRRPLFLLYTKKEIQKWRAERKRNYPSKSNVLKKMAQKQVNNDAIDEDAKLRREQLKEVLAKQQELGVEVAEIPKHYLSDNDDQLHGRNWNKRRLNNGRTRNRFNKRGRFDRSNRVDMRTRTEDNGSGGQHQQPDRRQKIKGNDLSKGPSSVGEPTLLQKLLSADMKQDRRRLLQALRFMVMNSFFKNWPEKPLNFPEVTVEEETWDEEDPSFLKELDEGIDTHDASDGSDGEDEGCQEEGEITD